MSSRDGDDAVTIRLPETTDYGHDAGRVCTEDETKLSNRTTATVAGPSVVAPVVPLVGVGAAATEEGDGVGLP